MLHPLPNEDTELRDPRVQPPRAPRPALPLRFLQRLRQLVRSVRERLELLPPHPQRHESPALVAEAEDNLAGGAVLAGGDEARHVDEEAGLALGLRLSSRHGGHGLEALILDQMTFPFES